MCEISCKLLGNGFNAVGDQKYHNLCQIYAILIKRLNVGNYEIYYNDFFYVPATHRHIMAVSQWNYVVSNNHLNISAWISAKESLHPVNYVIY